VSLDWTLPAPPNGVVATPTTDTNAQAALFFGEDVWLDVSQGEQAELIVTPAGDWQTVTGLAALKQSLLRRIITNPGEWTTKPGYGIGARQYVKAKDTPAMRAELTARVRAQFLADQRVESVDQVAIDKIVDGIGPVLRLNVQYTPRARLRTDQPQKITVELR
jgi:phage baseplate assembly protein W